MPAVQTLRSASPFAPANITASKTAQAVSGPLSFQTNKAPQISPHQEDHHAQGPAAEIGNIPGHVPLQWQLPKLADRPNLSEQARKLKPAEAQALLKQVPVSRSLPYPDSEDTRSPHRIVQTALALALKDQQIDMAEASELRGLMLTLLPSVERAKYIQTLAQAPMSAEAKPMLSNLDPDLSVYVKDFSAAEIRLIDSAAFKLVFPNFSRLSLSQQRQVISELNVFLKHFPQLLPALNSLKNDNYGPGFQYFFLESSENEAFDKLMPKNVVGVVMPGSTVVKDPLLRLLADKVSLRQLDRGGMYIKSIQQGVFSHEFAHVIHLNLLSDDQRDQIKHLYDKAWQQMRQSEGKQGFVSKYAQTNPYEYFAEGVEFYLTGDANQLKHRDLGLYQFVAELFKAGKLYTGGDGHLLNDPERVHGVVSQQGSRTLVGLSLSRESDLFSVRHFEGGVTQELAVLAGEDGAVARASLGLKAAWKPSDKPAGVYATAGGTVQAGVLGSVSVGAGGFVGAGVDYKHFNVELRQNWMAGSNTGSGTEIRAGLRFEF